MPRKNREEAKAYALERSRRMRKAALAALGGRCVRCGNSDYRVLQIDHINGGGHRELHGDLRLTGASHSLRVFRSVERQENKYQILCANCNWIKRHENEEFN